MSKNSAHFDLKSERRSVQDAQPSQPSAIVSDGLVSLTHSMGDPERDKRASVYFANKIISTDQLCSAYLTNWMCRNLVDIPVMDSMRRGWSWITEDHDKIKEEERRLNLAGKMMQAFKKGRLFGGAALFMATDQDPSEPLDVELIEKGGLKYLTVLTRLRLNAGEVDMDPQSEHYGTPKYYTISTPTDQLTIHPSHLVLFNGDERPDNISFTSQNGWPGVSIIQSTYDAIVNAEGANSSISSLLFEANIDVLKIPDLSAQIRSQQGENDVLKRIRLAALSKGVNGMLAIDSEEELERRSAAFGNMSPLMETFALFVAASGQIPATRFLAQSPSGLVATGESDMKNYYDLVSSKQKLEINPATAKMFIAVRRSALGDSEPIERTWSPLLQMDEQELAKISREIAETVKIMVESCGFHESEARVMVISKFEEVGSFAGLGELLDGVLGSSETSEPEDGDDPLGEEVDIELELEEV